MASLSRRVSTALSGGDPRGGTPDEFATINVATWTCLVAALWTRSRPVSQELAAWLVAHAAPQWREPLRLALELAADKQPAAATTPSPLATAVREALRAEGADELAALRAACEASGARGDCQGSDRLGAPTIYEEFLRHSSPAERGRLGVFFTPEPLVAHVVRRVDETLREELRLPAGLADLTSRGEVVGGDCDDPAEPFVQLVDPAAGAGAFLAELVRRTHRSWNAGVRTASRDERRRRWSEFLAESWLPRLWSYELSPAPAALAQLELGCALTETGYDLRPTRLRLRLADTLSGPAPGGVAPPPLSVVVGNPPYSGISANRGEWIEGLLRGDDRGRPTADYFDVAGQPLGERKVWLNDDYVKFLRWSHWQVERSGAGVVGLVVNHGLLDNLSFRGLREKLLRDFPIVEVLDLHGSVKGRSPGVTDRDENVFGIGQGTAVALLARPAPTTPPMAPTVGPTRRVRHAELRGTREEKLRALGEEPGGDDDCVAPAWREIAPAPPGYFLFPVRRADPDYESAPGLDELMPVHSTAPVTARDSLIVDRDRGRLIERLREFADLTIDDDTIRRRFFPSPRSSRYPPGDTRGWRLDVARRRLSAMPDWERLIVPCLYRPFDARHVLWLDFMVDWPRGEISSHLLGGDNLALLARRQTPMVESCEFLWATGKLPLDGVIRSDNRGSESFFPLWLNTPAGRRPNLDPDIVAAWCAHWETGSSLSPQELFACVYAILQSPTYRRRHAAELRHGFPRLPRVADRDTARRLATAGAALLRLHTRWDTLPPWRCSASGVHRATPVWRQGRLAAGGATFDDVSEELWSFHVGSYQVARRWWRARAASPAESAAFGRVLTAIRRTLRWRRRIDVWLF